jgi:riboflavin kinase
MTDSNQKKKNDLFNDLDILVTLGKMGGIRRMITCTTSELGNQIGISQQTTSRKLVEMENKNLIVRKYSQRGNSIRITPEGVANLEQLFKDLWMILTSSGKQLSEKIVLHGKVITGMAEGAFYMGKQAYRDQFSMLLGYTPFPGTLNLQILDDQTLNNFEKLLRLPAKFISGFKEDDRVYGKVFIWPALLVINGNQIPSAIVRPERTHHSNQIELIAEVNIKNTYNVQDGDELEVIIQ